MTNAAAWHEGLDGQPVEAWRETFPQVYSQAFYDDIEGDQPPLAGRPSTASPEPVTVDPYLIDRLFAIAAVGGEPNGAARADAIDAAVSESGRRQGGGAAAGEVRQARRSPRREEVELDRARAAQRWEQNTSWTIDRDEPTRW